MLPVVTIVRAGAALYSVQEATGFTGFDELAGSLGRLALKIGMRAMRHDRSALDEMVSLAKSRAPRDTGRLVNGISGEVEDDVCIFSASAVHEDKPRSQEDYARFVEFGTHAGQRGQFHEIVADEGFYAAPTTLLGSTRGTLRLDRRRSLRGHPGTEPQPFFFNSVHDVMAKRPAAMQAAVDDAAAEEGFA